MKVCVLLSGGMDSVTALYHAAQDHEVISALSFDYGSKHNASEIPCASWHAAKLGVPHTVITLPFINQHFVSDLLQSGGEIPDGHYAEENMKRTVVPFRNGIMLSIAAGFAESQGAATVVRGIRGVTDFEYEYQLTGMNRQLNDRIETIFLMADVALQPIASRLVKEIALYGGDIIKFVTSGVRDDVVARVLRNGRLGGG